ncbi:MAG: hypothetical protein EOO73_20865 [Myxococcales bacterium]|nr:MAG: hypothetical protein EOO73_20865 [Myxococcales bacterium]
MRFTCAASLAVFAVLFPLAARAHVDLVSPPPRQPGQAGGNQLKLKPCGQTTNKRTATVTTFSPGQQVEIKMKEYIDHPGYFAVAFDEDGDDSFVFPRANMDSVNPTTDDPKALFPVDGMKVLGLRLDSEKNCASEPDKTCTLSIKIPNVNCQNCTLQLTQFMYDKVGDDNDNEYYYQCADIKIEGPLVSGGGGGAGGGSAGGSGGSGGSNAGGMGGAPSGGVATGGTGPSNTSGAAGTGGASTSAGAPSNGGTASGGTSAGGSAASPSPAPSPPADEGGCAVSAPSSGDASWVAALGLGYAALLRRRRAALQRPQLR